MGVFVDIAQLVSQGWGWVIPLLYLFWQGFATRFVPNYEPMFAPLLKADDRLDTVESEINEAVDYIQELDKKQVHHIQVTRANARALDETTDVTIDSDEVDDYLVDNGVPVAQFTIGPQHADEETAEHFGSESDDR